MKKKQNRIVWMLVVIYTMFLVGLLYGDNIYNRGNVNVERVNHVNLEPFVEIKRYLNAIGTGALPLGNIIANLFGNFVLFMPLVVCFMLVVESFRKWYVTIPSFAVLICIVEYMQYLTGRGSCDIDDIILNLCGVLVVFLTTKLVLRKKM